MDYNSQVLFEEGWPLGTDSPQGPSVLPAPEPPPVIADEAPALQDVEVAEDPNSKKTVAESDQGNNLKR